MDKTLTPWSVFDCGASSMISSGSSRRGLGRLPAGHATGYPDAIRAELGSLTTWRSFLHFLLDILIWTNAAEPITVPPRRIISEYIRWFDFNHLFEGSAIV